MTTGKREKIGVRISKATGGAYADPREVIEDELARIKSEPIAAERTRLEREVIEAAKYWKADVLDGEGRQKLFAAVSALESFEAEQKK